MKQFFIKTSATLLTLIIFFAAHTALAAETAKFHISTPDGKPLKNMMIYVFDGDIYSKGSASELYPYGAAAKAKPTYLGEVQTDDKGTFILNPQSYAQHNLVFAAGSIYFPIGVEKAIDLAHTLSDDHIRVAQWADSTGKIQANYIYNWREQNVVKYTDQGSSLPQKPAPYIELNTVYLTRLAPISVPLAQSDINHLLLQLKTPVYQIDLLDKAQRAITSSDATLRGYAATYLGKFGTYESVPYMIDALDDAEVENAAALALKDLTGENFSADTAKWKDWLNERNLVIAKVDKYLVDTGRTELKIYRIHLNAEKTQWGASLQKRNGPSEIGAPALSIDRQTGAIDFIMGR